MAREFSHLRIKQQRFLKAYAKIGSVTGASQAVGVSQMAHYKWMKEIPAYAEAFHIAREMAADSLEEVAMERARKNSDLLMIFLLKALRPEIYREQKMIMGDPNNAIQHEMRIIVDRTDSNQTHLPAQKALGPGADSGGGQEI